MNFSGSRQYRGLRYAAMGATDTQVLHASQRYHSITNEIANALVS